MSRYRRPRIPNTPIFFTVALATRGSRLLIVNRQAILTPYRHPKMTPLERRDSWPDAV